MTGDHSELVRLCSHGRLFEVQAWIDADRPLQWRPGVDPEEERPRESALEVAIRTRQHTLCDVLLKGGFRPDEDRHSPFDSALRARRPDLVDLLYQHGADPRRADPHWVFDTYDKATFERFLEAGLDFVQYHALAHYLGEHSSNKPLFGFCRRIAPDNPLIRNELNLALVSQIKEGSARGAMLCLWAGADPHDPTSDLRYGNNDDDPEDLSAPVEMAVLYQRTAVLKACKPNPKRVDFDVLYGYAQDQETVQYLARRQHPRDLTNVIHSMLGCASWRHGSIKALKALFELEIRWESADRKQLGQIRRSLLDIGGDWVLRYILEPLQNPALCEPSIYSELTRTPAMQRRLKAMGMIKGKPKPPTQNELYRREIGNFALRFDRDRLYQEVWDRPVIEVAEQYGVSGSYIKQACRVLRVPTPPRGYWVRVQNGQQPARAKMRDLPTELEEIAQIAAGGCSRRQPHVPTPNT
jgi:hypothetical protein